MAMRRRSSALSLQIEWFIRTTSIRERMLKGMSYTC
jgi:hypothetical protein